jgi:hypothetical protein
MGGFRQITEVLAVCGGLALAGCGGSDDEQEAGGISEGTARALSGVYQLTRFTRNDSACDVEGPSVVAELTDTFFVMASTTVFGQRLLQLASCSSIDDCRSKAEAMKSLGFYSMEYSFGFSRELNPTHLTGFEATTGWTPLDGNMCTGRDYSDHSLTANSDASVVVESRTTQLADRPQEDGFCVVRPAESKAEAAKLPCSELRVLAGAKVAEL